MSTTIPRAWYTLWSHVDDGNDSFYRNDMGVPEREAWEALGTGRCCSLQLPPIRDA
jgi:hypothetical protein